MNREEKKQVIEDLKKKFTEKPNFYMADTSALSVAEINDLRRICYERGVELKVAKNTLITKALASLDHQYEGLDQALKGPTALFFSDVSNVPAKIIKEFRKDHDKPVLKAACIEEDVYLGDEQVEHLSSLKSKEEVIADIIALLQSPAKNVIAALQSGGNKLSGIVKTLSEKQES